MPPSPRIRATLNEPRFQELCGSLGLTVPPKVRISQTASTDGRLRLYGHYQPATRTITLYVGFNSDAIEKLRHVQSGIVNTLLHETRHAWQHDNWDADVLEQDGKRNYRLQRIELDANKFAQANQHKWVGLVRVARTQHGSGFSKLGRHATGRIV